MPRAIVFCNHYRAMSEHDTCQAGVSYESFRGLPFDQRPCFWEYKKDQNAGCALMQFPTPEQLAAEEAEINHRCELLGRARQAIVAHLGGPWQRGTPGARGAIDCPVCGGAQALRFSRAGYNGHIHAACATAGCVSWLE